MKQRMKLVPAAILGMAGVLMPGVGELRAETVNRVIRVITRSDLEARRQAEEAVPMALSESEIMSVESTLGKDSNITRGLASEGMDSTVPDGGIGQIGMQGPSRSVPASKLKPNKQFVTQEMVESAFAKGGPSIRKKFFVAAGGSLDETLGSMRAGEFAIGLLPEFMMYSVRLRVGDSTFGALRAYPDPLEDPTVFPSGSNPGSEYNRVRSNSDPWGFLLYDAGVGLQGKFLPYLFPNCSQRMRFQVGLGSLTDIENEIDFAAWHISIESGLQWSPSERSPFALDVSGYYQYGVGVRTDSASVNMGRLPFDWLGVTASIYIWL